MWYWYGNISGDSGTILQRYNVAAGSWPNVYASSVGIFAGGASGGGGAFGTNSKPCALMMLSGSITRLKYTGTALAYHSWNHIALTWDGNYAKLWVNGSLADSAYKPGATVNYVTTGGDSGHWNIGTSYNGLTYTNSPIGGAIDDLVFYNEDKDASWMSRAFLTTNGPTSAAYTSIHLEGRVMYGLAENGQSIADNWNNFTGNTVTAAATSKMIVPFVPNGTPTGQRLLSILTVDGSPRPGPSSIPYGKTTFIGGSSPTAYSGGDLVEHGIAQYPEFPVKSSTTTGGSLSPGTIFFRLTYETTDEVGNLHRSAPTPDALSVTLTTDTKIVLALPCTPCKAQKIVVWRTESNGANYYRAAEKLNNPSVESVSCDITEADTSITAYEPLYTDSGELPNSETPPYFVGASWKNRFFAVDPYDNTIWYTKEIVAGFGPAFTYYTYVNMEPNSGPITALIPMVDKLVICTANKTYCMEGTGLDALGGGSNFERPYIISHSTGCVNHKQMGQVNDGVMIKGKDIIWRLDPSLQMTPIGEQVRWFTDNYNISSIVADENHHSTLVFMDNGPTLCYDWLRNRWSTFTNRVAADATSVAGEIYWLNLRGSFYDILNESTTSYQDSVLTGTTSSPTVTGTYFSQLVDTGWIKVADDARYYKLFLYGYNLSPHSLQVRIQYNYNPNWEPTAYTFSSASTSVFSNSDYMGTGLDSSYANQAYVLELSLPKTQNIESIRFEISDIYRTGAADERAWVISKLALAALPKTTYRRRGAARKF